MKQFATGSRRLSALGAVTLLVASTSLMGFPTAQAVERPAIDAAALPPDGVPSPALAMRQTSYCAEVGVLPGSDFRVQPAFLDMLDLPEAWRFGRGAGVTVAVIDSGVNPHPRLPRLVGGGDYVVDGGDGLSDCDAHGTLVASLIAATPAGAGYPPQPRPPRKAPSVPTIDAPPAPPAPPAPAPTTVIVQVPAPAPAPAEPEPAPGEPEPAPDPLGPPPGPPPAPEAAQQSPAPEAAQQSPAPEAAQNSPAPEAAQNSPAPEAAQNSGAAPSSHVDGGNGADRIGAAAAGYSGGARWSTAGGIGRPAPREPAPAPSTDAFTGVAPEVTLISLRYSSQAFSPRVPPGQAGDPRLTQDAAHVNNMARAIVHAADLGAGVISISQVLCMDARAVVAQADLGAAVRYAAVERNAVIVAAAGDLSGRNCKQNPGPNPLRPDDPRNWAEVNTVVSPSWFDEFVLTVGAVDATGAPMDRSSIAGPWVSIAAPGSDIVGLSPNDDGLINAVVGQNDSLMVPTGSAYSAALVAGVAALVRAKFPTLSSAQVRNRLIRTARPPARGVDNRVGFGVVDPVAALTWDVPDGPAASGGGSTAPLSMPAPPSRDMVPVYVAAAALTALAIGTVAALLGAKLARRTVGK